MEINNKYKNIEVFDEFNPKLLNIFNNHMNGFGDGNIYGFMNGHGSGNGSLDYGDIDGNKQVNTPTRGNGDSVYTIWKY
jgi:hypothetical protein